MNTLESFMAWVEARSSKDDGCLIWRASLNGSQPQGGALLDGKKTTINVRRHMWTLKHGKPPPKKWVIVCKCDSERCVEPSHLKAISRSQLLAGRPISAAHKIALTLAARSRKNIKLTQEDVYDIRYGDGTTAEKARRYGISEEHAGGIIAQRWWKDLTSPFAGLGA